MSSELKKFLELRQRSLAAEQVTYSGLGDVNFNVSKEQKVGERGALVEVHAENVSETTAVKESSPLDFRRGFLFSLGAPKSMQEQHVTYLCRDQVGNLEF